MAQVKTYDPKQVVVSFADRRITGFADGDFVNVVPLANAFESYVGSDGSVSRARTNDDRVTVSFTLAQTSPSNDVLSQLAALDRVAANGAGVGRLLIQDLSGSTLLEGPAWIERMPDVTLGREIGSRAWTLLAAVENWTVGGNS